MATNLVQSQITKYLSHVGASNSFFTGTIEVNQGNIANATGADPLFNMYQDNAGMWSGGISTPAIPSIFETGQFVIIDSVSIISDLSADYTCKRNASVITTGGRIQLAISTNNGNDIVGGNDARFCLYYPSEDFNQEVLAYEYITTDAADVNGGNNIALLLANITGRMKNFSGNNGPVCNGTSVNDLLDDGLSIFALGCVLTWETAATSGNAIVIGPGA
tara:strand:- start:36 stop:692 length:657 start_codon:yes stop_codon:yes gene_type:complete